MFRVSRRAFGWPDVNGTLVMALVWGLVSLGVMLAHPDIFNPGTVVLAIGGALSGGMIYDILKFRLWRRVL